MNWLHFALGIVMAGLQMAIKNPQSVAKEAAILAEIRNLIDELIPPNPPIQ